MEHLEPVELPRYPDAEPRALRVLVAEDNQINQALISRFLDMGGCEVKIVSNGRDAIDAVRYNAPAFDLVLMDIKMPGVDGIEAASTIRSLEGARGNVTILAFTANVSDEDMERYLNAGIDGVVAKPVSRDALFATIKQAMAGKGAA